MRKTTVILTLEVEDDGTWGFDQIIDLYDEKDVPFVADELIREDVFGFYEQAMRTVTLVVAKAGGLPERVFKYIPHEEKL